MRDAISRLPLTRWRALAGRAGRFAVDHGLPPAWVGRRWMREVSPDAIAESVVVHPAAAFDNPLPINVDDGRDLPDDAGWWGYSMRDVPHRAGAPTLITTIRDARVVGYRDERRGDDYYPAVITGDDRALTARELRFRRRHADLLRQRQPAAHLTSATWVLERVFHNHSHWLNAHLPKLVLLRDRGELDDVLLPDALTPAMEGSLRRLGMPPDRFPRFDPTRPLRVDRLRVVTTDRFRPELLQGVQRALLDVAAPAGGGRSVVVSRAHAGRRRLENEDELVARLAPLGFERVVMEHLTFDEQMQTMAEAAVLVGPHGAGLTNMIGCRPGTHVVEIADPAFPNPNFYAMAVALGQPYALVPAMSLGDGRPTDRDLRVDVGEVVDVVGALGPDQRREVPS